MMFTYQQRSRWKNGRLGTVTAIADAPSTLELRFWTALTLTPSTPSLNGDVLTCLFCEPSYKAAFFLFRI